MIAADEQAALRSLIEDYVALSKGMRFAEKRTFWDVDEPMPVLSPEESERLWRGWDEIEAYWTATKGALVDLQSDCWGILIQPLSSKLALALFNLGWTAHVEGLSNGTALGAHVRVTAALRRKPEGWRFFSYIEGHVDAVEYMRSYYRAKAVSGTSRAGRGE